MNLALPPPPLETTPRKATPAARYEDAFALLNPASIDVLIKDRLLVIIDTSVALAQTSSVLPSRAQQEPAHEDYVLDSQPFVPEELTEFAARGFARKNRWS